MNGQKIVFLIMAGLLIGGTFLWMVTGNTAFVEPPIYTALPEKADLPQNTGGETAAGGSKIKVNIIGKTGSSTDFFENARLEFMKIHKDVEINYIGKGTFDAIDYINDNENAVDGWLCADETGADILRNEYSKSHGGKDIILDVSPIVTSPLVLVGWEERLNKIPSLGMTDLYGIVASGKSWSELGGDSSWGFFNFSHTNPMDSNSGVQFITLLIHNYYQQQGTPKKDLTVEDVSSPQIMEYLKKFEKNTAKQIDGSGKFMDMIVQFGPSRFDIGANYEYYVLSNIKNAQGRWGKLKVIYPVPTIWSNKPMVILNTTPEKIAVVKEFRDYLLSAEVQKKAVLEGYRPANTAVSDLSYMEKEFSAFGFKKDISASVPAPGQEVIENIRSLIKRVQ